MASGYDISASASQATSASGGATRLGNVNILSPGGSAGISGFSLVLLAAAGMAAYWFFSQRKKK